MVCDHPTKQCLLTGVVNCSHERMKLHVHWANGQTRTWDLPAQYLGATRKERQASDTPQNRSAVFAPWWLKLSSWPGRHGCLLQGVKPEDVKAECNCFGLQGLFRSLQPAWSGRYPGHSTYERTSKADKHEQAQHLVKHGELHTSCLRLDCISKAHSWVRNLGTRFWKPGIPIRYPFVESSRSASFVTVCWTQAAPSTKSCSHAIFALHWITWEDCQTISSHAIVLHCCSSIPRFACSYPWLSQSQWMTTTSTAGPGSS